RGIKNLPNFARLKNPFAGRGMPVNHQGCGRGNTLQKLLPERLGSGEISALQPVNVPAVGGRRGPGLNVALLQFSIGLENFTQKDRKATAVEKCVVEGPNKRERCLIPLEER